MSLLLLHAYFLGYRNQHVVNFEIPLLLLHFLGSAVA